MSAEETEAIIQTWFERRYPDGPRWRSRDFHCFQETPAELRIFPMMDVMEAEIVNGGLAQLLWNVFYHWRVVLRDAAQGYKLIGAMRQVEALEEFQNLFLQHEPVCRTFVEQSIAEQSGAVFNRWYEHGELLLNSDRERLFYQNSDLRARRLKWMEKNRHLLLRALAEA